MRKNIIMEIHVHLFAEKAKIFDQYSLIIVHWQNDKRGKERAKEEDERENKLEEAEANSRLGREMKEREINSLAPPRHLDTPTSLQFFEERIPGI